MLKTTNHVISIYKNSLILKDPSLIYISY